MAASFDACCAEIRAAIASETARVIAQAGTNVQAEVQPLVDIAFLQGGQTSIRGMTFDSFGEFLNRASSFGRGFGTWTIQAVSATQTAYAVPRILQGDRVEINGAVLASGDYTIGTNQLTLAYPMSIGDVLTVKSWRI